MVPTLSTNRRTALRTPLSSHLASQACLKTLLEQAVRAHKANQICSFAVADVRNRDRLVWFGGSYSYIISFRLDVTLRRLKIIYLRLEETASINLKLYIIKRYTLFD